MSKKEKSEDKLLVEFIGEVISTESALLASSINLMRAGDSAKNNGDTESLIKVAHAWYSLARYLAGEDEDHEDKKHTFGFAALETVDDPGVEPDTGEGGTEVRSKSR